MSDTITAVDLFCGAGGLSAGLARACEQDDRDVELAAVNHDADAIEMSYDDERPEHTERLALSFDPDVRETFRVPADQSTLGEVRD